MNYTETSTVKSYLWITATTYDAVIGSMVEDSDVEIHSALDIDWFVTWTKTEIVQRQDVVISWMWFYALYLRNYNVLTVTHLNWTAYTGTKSITGDYYIMLERKVLIKELYNAVSQSVDNFGFFEIKYTYWYAMEDVPDDIKLLAKLKTAVAFRDKYPTYSIWGEWQMQWLSSYQLWDERIAFREQSQSDDKKEIERILAKYKKPHVLS